MVEDHPTEAACLLEQGASYRRRIGLKPVVTPGDPIFAGFKQGAFSLYFGDAPIYHFDLEGRWQRAFVDGTHYLKGLDATVHAIDRVREGPNLVLKRRTLTCAEAADFDERVRSTALELIAGLDAGTAGTRRTRVAQGTAAGGRRPARFSRTDQLVGFRRVDRSSRTVSARPTARSHSCRPNARTRSFCKRPWAMRRGLALAARRRTRPTRDRPPSLRSTP